eukprot:scaffold297788_cov53-Prasinocladus_malaysianus.AAC.1
MQTRTVASSSPSRTRILYPSRGRVLCSRKVLLACWRGMRPRTSKVAFERATSLFKAFGCT